MFSPEFGKSDYGQDQLCAVFFLELIMRMLVCLGPSKFDRLSKHELKKRFKRSLEILGVPQDWFGCGDVEKLIGEFIEGEFGNIKTLAQDIRDSRLDGLAALRKRGRLSIPAGAPTSLRRLFSSGELASWFVGAEERMKRRGCGLDEEELQRETLF